MESTMDQRFKSTLTAMNHFSVFTMVSAFTTVATGLIGLSAISVAKADEVITPWGEPDLQGIWTDEFDAPLQRSAKFANQEFFTAIQREELDKQRAAHYVSGDSRRERGTVNDVNGTDNSTVFLSIKHTGPRTSLQPTRGLRRLNSTIVSMSSFDGPFGPGRRSPPDFSATFTTVAFDDSSLRWLEINT